MTIRDGWFDADSERTKCDKRITAMTEPRRAEEKTCIVCGKPITGPWDSYQGDGFGGLLHNACRAPAPSPEPQGGEGQRWILRHLPPCQGSGSGGKEEVFDFYPTTACCEGPCERLHYVPHSLLAVAEARLAGSEERVQILAEHLRDRQSKLAEWVLECDGLREALRVAEERAAFCDEKWAEAVEDWRSLNERFVYSERKREEAVGLLAKIFENPDCSWGDEYHQIAAFLAAERKGEE
jgi:hypothetical protein